MSEGNGLPKGWVDATLGELLHGIEGGTSFKCLTRTATAEEWGVIKVSAMTWGTFLEDEQKALPAETVFDPSAEIKPGDLLLSRCNTVELVGASVLVGECRPRLLLSDKSLRLLVAEGIHRRWLYRVLNSQMARQQMSAVATGSSNSMRNISQDKINAVRISLPPLPEQHRIVEKIEELFSDLDAGVASLQRAKANLKRYRASVLKSAVEGRLTEEWRKEHPHAEDGAMLLDRILRERREKWEKDQLQKFKEKGKEPPKNWESKYEEPSAPDTSELPELPEGWAWGSLDMLLREPLRNGHSARTSEDGTGVRTISITAVTYNAFTEDNIKYTIADPVFVEDLWLEPGDILIQRSNTPELVGTARLFTGESHFAIFPDLLIRIRTTPEVSVRYVSLLLQASATRQYFRSHAKGLAGSMPKIDQGTVLKCPVPLPTLEEQERIADEVAERLSQIDSAEKTIDSELIRSKRLRQSILKRAFEGKLVPQDPKDEPASVLLERIKASREAEQPKKKAKKATKVKAK